MNKNPIYTITTMRGSLYGGTRCVGFFHSKEDAIEAVENNSMDINEDGYYHYCVIEATQPGIYNFLQDETWFRWHNTKGYQKLTTKPEKFRRVVCFGIG